VLASYGSRIRTIHQANAGQSAAVNAGFAAAAGDVVVLLDADDLLLPDTARQAVQAFAADPRLVRVQWPLELIDEGGRRTGSTIPPAGWRLPTGDLADVALRYRTYVWNPTSASAYRRSALGEVLPMPERTYLPNTGPDLYLSETVVLLGRVGALDRVGGLYRLHSKNFTTTSRRDDVSFLRTKVDEIVAGQRHVQDVAQRRGLEAPADPRTAKDWAFAAYRISLLRADPPVPGSPGTPWAPCWCTASALRSATRT
jgi:glycosyltransferase involved in cell wall biosynthesis